MHKQSKKKLVTCISSSEGQFHPGALSYCLGMGSVSHPLLLTNTVSRILRSKFNFMHTGSYLKLATLYLLKCTSENGNLYIVTAWENWWGRCPLLFPRPLSFSHCSVGNSLKRKTLMCGLICFQ